MAQHEDMYLKNMVEAVGIMNKRFTAISLLALIFSLMGGPATAAQSEMSELPTTTREMAKRATQDRKETLKEMKSETNFSQKDEKKLKTKSRARTMEKIGGKIASASGKVSGYLASSNFLTNTINLANAISPVPFLNPLIVIGLLNNVVGVVGEGIEAYGGYSLRKAALADMAFGKMIDVNDLNEATKALENIEALQEIEKKISGQKTIKMALEKEGPDASKKKKLLAYLNPSHLENTVKRFTDDLHITANQKNAEEKLVKIREQRKKEEENYDNIVKRLQSRFLNRVMLDLKDALDKVEKINHPKPFPAALVKRKPELADQLDKLDYNTYKKQLNTDLEDAKTAKDTFSEKDPKKLQELQARQDIHINKLETRLAVFEKVYHNPDGAKEELEKLKKEMLALASTAKSTGSSENDTVQALGKKVSEMAAKLEELESKVAALHHAPS